MSIDQKWSQVKGVFGFVWVCVQVLTQNGLVKHILPQFGRPFQQNRLTEKDKTFSALFRLDTRQTSLEAAWSGIFKANAGYEACRADTPVRHMSPNFAKEVCKSHIHSW